MIYNPHNELLSVYKNKFAWTYNNVRYNNTITYSYSYSTDEKLTGLSINYGSGADATVSYVYDSFDRITNINSTLGSISKGEEYTFTSSGSNTSSQIATYKSTFGSTSTTYTYTYDGNGNITKIHDGTYETRYVYDNLGQLIREDNEALEDTYVYTYDNAGNILSKSTYGFTAEGVTPTNPTETKAYQYSNSQWGDLLVQMGDDSATYDEIGNPVSFEFGLADIYINWNGRLVKSVSAGIGPISLVNVSFQYNSDGIRTKKGNTNYYLSGSTIVGEETNGNVTLYIYDANGSILGFQYKSTTDDSWYTYWYEKNIFGDIIAVYSSDGTKLVSYVYDAWGNTSVSYHNNATASSPAGKNPFRYRGYYYDSELYMYYLGSRYYYPAIGRFLSADESSYLGANGDLNSYNLFAYCSNNPVMFTDPTGHASKWWEKALDIGAYVISAAVAVGVGAVVARYTGSKEAAIAAGVATFALVNNATNFAYYTFIADGETDITSTSYQDGYISRWDRLDYVKHQTQEDWYNPTAWIYYSEYNVHMYGYYAFSFVDGALDLLGYSQRSENFTVLLDRAGEADIVPGELDRNDILVAVTTIVAGLFGI